MRIPRCFVQSPLAIGATVPLPASACDHLLRVLRLPEGAPLVLCNGDGMDYHARLVDVGKRAALAQVVQAAPNGAESPLAVVLVQALARGEKMDWIIQKATELGVAGIAPVITERTEVRLDAERAQRRLAHWQAVASAACEQCGRARLPVIAAPAPLSTFLADMPGTSLPLVLNPDGAPAAAILDALRSDPDGRSIHLVVGPEGGLSERDRAQLRTARFRGWRLGPRILRTETAGPAALAVLQALAGDLRES